MYIFYSIHLYGLSHSFFCFLLLIQPVGTRDFWEHCCFAANPGTNSSDHCNYLDHELCPRFAISWVIYVVLLLFLFFTAILSNILSGECRTSKVKLMSVQLKKVRLWILRQFMGKQFFSQNLDLVVQVTCFLYHLHQKKDELPLLLSGKVCLFDS